MLGLDIMHSGMLSVLPWITMAIMANVGGWIADMMIEKGVSVTTVSGETLGSDGNCLSCKGCASHSHKWGLSRARAA